MLENLKNNSSAEILKSLEENSTDDLHNISELIKSDIDSYTSKVYDDGFRWHLGASSIGDECKRKLWYRFRWVGQEKVSGRMQRLFNRGHLEELRHVEWLKGLGFLVWTRDESKLKEDGTHPQLRINNLCNGHFGGSLDGIIQFPANYNISGYAILESKTNGTGAGFNALGNKGLTLAKPQHYIQTSVYGKSYNIQHVLYICANKNDDDLYIEVAKLDFKLADQMEEKAKAIIFAKTPPEKLSENPTHLQCKNLCEFKDICHFKKPAVKNCRSCVNCTAVDNASFYCDIEQGIIPKKFVYSGCDNWKSITY